MMPTDKHRQSVSIRCGVLQMSTDKFKISNWEKNIAQDVIPGDINAHAWCPDIDRMEIQYAHK